eukprot:28097-Pyramimonas_sp.AAC.1
MSLRLLSWNPLSFNTADRQEEVINTTCRSFHICVFIGTQHRALPDCPVQKRHINGVLLVEAGAGKGPYTNKSTGIAFTLAC